MSSSIIHNQVEAIHAAIRLQNKGYETLTCPQCKDRPYVERNDHYPGSLWIRCSCGLLNTTE